MAQECNKKTKKCQAIQTYLFSSVCAFTLKLSLLGLVMLFQFVPRICCDMLQRCLARLSCWQNKYKEQVICTSMMFLWSSDWRISCITLHDFKSRLTMFVAHWGIYSLFDKNYEVKQQYLQKIMFPGFTKYLRMQL